MRKHKTIIIILYKPAFSHFIVEVEYKYNSEADDIDEIWISIGAGKFPVNLLPDSSFNVIKNEISLKFPFATLVIVGST